MMNDVTRKTISANADYHQSLVLKVPRGDKEEAHEQLKKKQLKFTKRYKNSIYSGSTKPDDGNDNAQKAMLCWCKLLRSSCQQKVDLSAETH